MYLLMWNHAEKQYQTAKEIKGREKVAFVKTRRTGNSVFNAVVFIIAAVVMLCLGVSNFIKYSAKPTDIKTADPSKLKNGQYVSMEIDNSLDCYCLNTKETRRYGIKTSESKDGGEYAIPLMTDGEEIEGYKHINYVIGYKVNQSKMDTFDRLVDDTFERTAGYEEAGKFYGYIYGGSTSPIKIEGSLKKMQAQEKNYLMELLQDYGYSYAQASEMIIPYVIKFGNISSAYAFLIGGAVMLIVGLIILALHSKAKKKEEAMTYAGYNPGSTNVDPYGSDTYGNNTYGSQGMTTGAGVSDTLYTGNAPASDTLYTGAGMGANNDKYGSYMGGYGANPNWVAQQQQQQPENNEPELDFLKDQNRDNN